MDEVITSRWNRVAKDDSRIIHIGDFGKYDTVKNLRGRITLICGNYEVEDIKKIQEQGHNLTYACMKFRENLITLGFEDVIFEKLITNGPDGGLYCLCHEPVDCIKGAFNLFGHIHKLQMVKRFGLNVGIDCHNFKPITFKEVLWYKNAIENHYDNNVFI
jgi:calcineurin-like phosphoesterase family protein